MQEHPNQVAQAAFPHGPQRSLMHLTEAHLMGRLLAPPPPALFSARRNWPGGFATLQPAGPTPSGCACQAQCHSNPPDIGPVTTPCKTSFFLVSRLGGSMAGAPCFKG